MNKLNPLLQNLPGSPSELSSGSPSPNPTDTKVSSLSNRSLSISTATTYENNPPRSSRSGISMGSRIAPLSMSPQTIFEGESARSFSPTSFDYENPIPSDEFSPISPIAPPSLEAQRWGRVKDVMRLVLMVAAISILACFVFSVYVAGYYVTVPLTIALIALYVHKIASEKEEELNFRSPVVYPVPQSIPGPCNSTALSTHLNQLEEPLPKQKHSASNLEARKRLAQISQKWHERRSHSRENHQASFPF